MNKEISKFKVKRAARSNDHFKLYRRTSGAQIILRRDLNVKQLRIVLMGF